MHFEDNQVDLFYEQGFIILYDFFKIEELNEFKKSLRIIIKDALNKASKKYDEIIPEEFEGKEFDEGIIQLEKVDFSYIADIYDIIPNIPSFLRLISKKELSEIINKIFNKPISNPLYTFTNRCRIDPPQIIRRKTQWHQEIFYTIPKSEFVQIWGPMIRDITKENGGIEICIGSHKEGIAKQSFDNSENNPTPFMIDPEIVEKYQKKIIELKLGDLMIFSPKLFHRSGSNIDNHVRYTQIGMFHNIEFSTFRPTKPNIFYKEKSPEEYYNDFFS